eukprot:2789824-Amphidinium_carterae.4
MTDTGLMLRLALCSPSGLLVESHAVSWKTEETVYWELRRFLAPAGFKETKGMPLKEHVRRNFDSWNTYLQFLGLPATSLTRSAGALQSRGVDVHSLAEAGQEHRATTAGLLAILLNWAHFRRAHEHKERAITLLRALLSQTLNPDPLEEMLEQPDVPDHPHVCDKHMGQPGSACQCWKSFLLEVASSDATEAAQFRCASVLLAGSTPAAAQCPTVRARYGAWGDSSWHKSAAASMQGRQKQRRISTQVKEWVATSVTEGRFTSGESAMQALENTSVSCFKHWRASDLIKLRMAMHTTL